MPVTELLLHLIADDRTINVMDFPQQLADALGMPLFAGQILASLLLMLGFILPVLFITKGKNMLMALIMGFSTMCLCVALAWLPIWVLLMVALIAALMMAGQMRNWLGGGG